MWSSARFARVLLLCQQCQSCQGFFDCQVGYREWPSLQITACPGGLRDRQHPQDDSALVGGAVAIEVEGCRL